LVCGCQFGKIYKPEMQKIKTIIVDDELEAREGVELLLQSDPEIDIVCLCNNGIEAIDAINDFSIELMFLDIQMPVVDGFEVIRSVDKQRLPKIIFTTAYDQYALKAFEVHAMDYLLKPFTDARFYEALAEAKKVITKGKALQQPELIKIISDKNINQNENIELIHHSDTKEINRLIIKEAGQVFFIKLAEIQWIEAYDYYVKIHVQGRFHLLRKSMKKLEELLPKDYFARVHKSSIVNLQYIKNIKILGNGEYEINLNNSVSVKVSRSYKNAIKHLLG
jgi:two-component system LytT family response regulator